MKTKELISRHVSFSREKENDFFQTFLRPFPEKICIKEFQFLSDRADRDRTRWDEIGRAETIEKHFRLFDCLPDFF